MQQAQRLQMPPPRRPGGGSKAQLLRTPLTSRNLGRPGKGPRVALVETTAERGALVLVLKGLRSGRRTTT